MLKKWSAIAVVALLALTMGLVGCGSSKSEQPAAKVLKVGAEATFPPFEFQDENNKDYVGFDVDLMKAIGKQMGMEVQIVNTGFDGLIPALEGSQIDVIASAMSITAERANKVAFSKPYYKSGLSIVVKADNSTINNFKDLEGKRIAVQIGTTGAENAKKIKDAKVREFNSASEAYLELKAGGADAVVNDLPVNEYYLAKGGSKDAKLVGEVLNAEEYGIAVAKKNTELANKINKALDELKQNGEYAKIYEKWFGKKPQ
ncbi:basic amino acid ABC transporter substrate-binding protein [Sporomusa acidovorans]|uniref:Glutamine-binding periplasmic protein n=1 Tax=Sporomusa acidovorans (strain ATCC 49682 / DSM 3132 / Mol) TaxID=1123286 RepID=A0ABZ3IVH9_SPOA4|nr:basic amino acid ABC transporter substrate-binding protein [Sporomusa acidovorans]OZC15266.1 glutamine-binding periplasmic protein precursor [Sporomusa acidovorans DSM 3132]SDE91629.1 polar amino acid transport system substrate-binding protein [Sporomusa acidovorans]